MCLCGWIPFSSPLGWVFAQSLERYFRCRERWPEAEMMMGVGNISEMTDVDPAGAHVLLAAICQELRIRSVLTTQVISWAQSAVAELDVARRLVFHAIHNRIPAKHLTSDLVMLRDAERIDVDPQLLATLADQIRDHDLRVFADGDKIHLVGRQLHLQAADPFEIFDELEKRGWKNLSPSHAFYLGYEMCKAMTANTRGQKLLAG